MNAREELKVWMFNKIKAIEPGKSKNEDINDPRTQEMLGFFADLFIERQCTLIAEVGKPLPCPFCGNEMYMSGGGVFQCEIDHINIKANHDCPIYDLTFSDLEAWNRRLAK